MVKSQLQRSRWIAVAIWLLVPIIPTQAQYTPIPSDNLPSWEANTRFRDNDLTIKHPSLSFNGFDCGNRCDYGYGLKQILDYVYDANDARKRYLWRTVATRALEVLQPASSFGNITRNISILQARSIVALASYVLSKNDIDPRTLNPELPLYSDAIESFRSALLNTTAWRVDASLHNDGVHWALHVTSIARAIDFYLALENAHKKYDHSIYADSSSVTLLSVSEKDQVMQAYFSWIYNFLEMRKLPGGLSRYTLEPGNAPLKIAVAGGYAMLTWQPTESSNNHRKGAISYAFRAAGGPADGGDENRRREYWNYQADSGKLFWAEGPYYFHITLSEVVPFWHTVRINDWLSNTAAHGYTFADPFRSDWFLKPLHWLADISTPDGKTPSLDDGNKAEMGNTSILRWTSAYGDGAVGRKFAYITDPNQNSALYPIELALPLIESVDTSPLSETIGNTYANRAEGENGRQEALVRRTIGGRQHYLLLNGESGDAILRGEGHEQGDQMQLLYYVDDVSYLMDTGYDRPRLATTILPPWVRWYPSTWNRYDAHNVMTANSQSSPSHGGVAPPSLNRWKQRVESTHQSVDSIFVDSQGKIDILSASIFLHTTGTGGSTDPESGAYTRTALFIHDETNPYVIDVNSVHVRNENHLSAISYWSNSSSGQQNLQDRSPYILWTDLRESKTGNPAPPVTTNRLLVQPFSVEVDPLLSVEMRTTREAYLSADRGVGLDTRVLGVATPANLSSLASYAFTSVAFIRPLFDGAALPADLVNAHLGPPANDTTRAYQSFSWKQSDTVVDLLVVRGAWHRESAEIRERLLATDIKIIVPEADSIRASLPRNKSIGFARYVKTGGIWKIDNNYQLNIEEVQTGIAIEARPTLATSFSLGQNYPNPFRASTRISFDLPRSAHVMLKVYNTLGQVVRVLVDGRMEAGRFSIPFEAHGLPAGTYYYHLITDGYSQTRPMTYIK